MEQTFLAAAVILVDQMMMPRGIFFSSRMEMNLRMVLMPTEASSE